MDEEWDEATQIRWFGPAPWTGAVCTHAKREDIPVGERCQHCKKKITADDRGIMIYDTGARTHKPWHLRCLMEHVGI